MRAPHTRLYGSRLLHTAPVTLKGVNIVRQINSKWADMWNTWNWESWIKPQIDVSIAAGANCIKVAGSGISPEDGFSYPATATFQARIKQLVGYCRQNGAVVYWNLAAHPFYLWGNSGTSYASNIASVQATAAYLESLPGIVGIDICNEINNSGPTTWNGPNYAQAQADLTQFVSDLRAVTSLPLTISVDCQAVADITGSWMQAAANAGIDIHDYHPYYTSATPAATDVTSLRTQSWYKGRFLIGENGSSVAQGSTTQTNWTTALGTIAALTDCYGVVLFCAADYDTVSSNQFGMYDTSVHNGRSQLLSPFASWPGKL